ncbi:integrin beta-like protein 1 [Mytilus trossulus]|uniref:integrin beta-like protein 1 n=1 Tax=Mytilus trossulus TaxID=6551 RepID=UPI00300420DF
MLLPVTAMTNTTGYCNLQDNLCYCRPVTAKRAACHNGHQCACPDGQNGVCNAQGHCECGDHPVGKRADCHNGHQCSCPDGQNGVCNSHGHCDCGDHTVGKRAVHVGSHCGQKSDCAGLDCAGKDYDCINMKCACHENGHAGGR